ncbi:MAG: DUF4340 domain-containing protein [Cyanobacteria bacterium CRU_2_1]|nr:DUF4340 domain-containing protein [Cyanobacteria bacterium RU_5_0]NJR57700.1 DUF4340 domain-containing protein [Cyanobacteria bacterium CRU_2_1]
MKIKPSTFFLVLSALLLSGVVLVAVQTQEPVSQQAEESGQQDLFTFEEEQVKSLTVQTPTEMLKFERDGEGKWQMLEPENTPASGASIAFLLDLMATGSSDRSVTVPMADLPEFGFEQPLATVEATLDNQETHRLILGGYDFNRSYIYAQTDPPSDSPSDVTVLLVSPNFENAVTRPLEEWKQPPEPPSEPSASPDPSASPSPEASPLESPTELPEAQVSPEAQDSSSPETESPSLEDSVEPQP